MSFKQMTLFCATLLCAAVMTAQEAAAQVPAAAEGSGGQAATPTEGGVAMEPKEPKILVVYFSRSGNTESVASLIASKLNADSEKLIEQGTDWEGVWGYLKAGKAAWQETATSIEKLKKNPKDYDLVVIGTPIWAWNMTPAIRSFLTVYKDDLKKVAFFATEGGSGHEKAFKNMETLTGKAPVATAAVLEKEVKKGDTMREKVATLATEIKKALGISSSL
ncbi:MAG TPA: flavodoxin [bacterium]|nr:flavodoxin [bacterium]